MHLPMQDTQETRVGVRKIPLEEGVATHSRILAWRIPWTEKPGGLQSTGSHRVGNDGAAERVHSTFHRRGCVTGMLWMNRGKRKHCRSLDFYEEASNQRGTVRWTVRPLKMAVLLLSVHPPAGPVLATRAATLVSLPRDPPHGGQILLIFRPEGLHLLAPRWLTCSLMSCPLL